MLPLMLLIMVTTLMLQLQSFSRVFLVLLTAPLGLIGVTAALLIFHLPFGFVAMLGVIALGGIIMRNSVILVDQIEQDIAAGHTPYQAIIDATVRRARPILLTAAAAILAMIPLAPSVFWGPMAVAIMGGLAAATLLTLIFLPALYAAWFRVQLPAPEQRAMTRCWRSANKLGVREPLAQPPYSQNPIGHSSAPMVNEARIVETGRLKNGQMLPSDLISDVTKLCSTIEPITTPSTSAATG